MNENLSELFERASARTVTIAATDGHPMAKVKLLHAAAVAAACVIMAPRLTAAAAVGALLSGITVRVDGPATEAD